MSKCHLNRTSSLPYHCPQHHCGTAHQPWNGFLTMAEKLPLPSPLIYLAPSHILLPRRRRSHAIITPYGQRQKNGENKLRLRDFTVLTLTIFSIKLLFPGPSHDRWYLNLQTDFYPAAYSDRFCLLQSSRDENRNVRNDWVLDIFQFFCSPFFRVHCYFRGPRVICDIAVHSPIFAPPPPPPAHIYWNRAATQKKRWETIVFQRLFSSSTRLFFN